MKIFLIGVGGAGNKAVIHAIEKGVVTKQDALLLNTTLSDITEGYEDIAIKFGNSRGGCGKERHKAKSYMMEGLQRELKDIDFISSNPDVELVMIATSTEGGTGSGSSILLAQYINQVLGLPVQIFAFNGFEEDGRGLKNTVEFFQEMDSNLSIQCTSNSAFISDTNKLTSEKASNEDFVERLRVLIGYDMIDSNQNIDSTDLFKVSTQTGYTVADRIELPKIKNVEQYNKVIKEALDNDESLDTTKTVKRLAIIVNASEETRDNIDFYWTKFKDKFGQPYEVYTHVQYDNNAEWIAYIASGLELPLNEVKEVYSRYLENTELVNKKKDAFHEEAAELKIYQSDDMFDMENNVKVVTKDSFFKTLGSSSNNNDNNKNLNRIKIKSSDINKVDEN